MNCMVSALLLLEVNAIECAYFSGIIWDISVYALKITAVRSLWRSNDSKKSNFLLSFNL